MYCNAPNTVSRTTDRVSTSTYQPRISVSISNAQEASRSAGHWKRKLRIRNGENIACRRCGSAPCHCFSSLEVPVRSSISNAAAGSCRPPAVSLFSASAPRRDTAIAHAPRAFPMLRCSIRYVTPSRRAPEHVGEVVVDRVQMLRGGVDGTHLDHEAVADHAITERLFRRIRAVPGKVHGLAVARPDALLLC